MPNKKIQSLTVQGVTYDIVDNTSGYTSNTGTITSVKTTAGAHTTINVSSGAAEFNVPTKTSDLINDSGFITNDLDEKVKYVPLQGTDTNRYGLLYAQNNGTSEQTSSVYTGQMRFQPSAGTLSIFNATGSRVGTLTPFKLGLKHNTSTYGGDLVIASLTASRTYTLPDASGTIALISDIPAETDPIFVASAAHRITSTDITNWNNKLDSYTETDPTVPAWAKATNKPSYTFSEIGSKPTTISGYGITDAYTKTQVDGLVAGVLHYKGAKASVADLPTTGNVIGDVWHITADGSEYAWDGSVWQELGTAIDLSGYATKATTLAGYEISDAKIENGTITLGSNSITPLISFTETDPVFTASPAYGITSTNISNWNSAEANVLEGIQVNGTDLTVTNKKVNVTKDAVVGNALKVTRPSDATPWDIDSWQVNSQDVDADISFVSVGMNLKQGTLSADYRFYTAGTVDVFNSMTANALNSKVDKETGKGLSTNDFTDTLLSKLNGIETGAEVNVQSNWNETDTTSDAYINNKPTIPTIQIVRW